MVVAVMHGLHELDLFAIPNRRVKTTAPHGVTGRPGLVNQHKDTILIAVIAEIDQLLRMPAGFALDPKRLP